MEDKYLHFQRLMLIATIMWFGGILSGFMPLIILGFVGLTVTLIQRLLLNGRNEE